MNVVTLPVPYPFCSYIYFVCICSKLPINNNNVIQRVGEVFSLLVTWSEMGKQKSNMASASDNGDNIFLTKTLVFVPRFSYIQINQHLKDSGRKEIGQKGYKFFVENYIHDVYVGRPSRQGDLAYIVQARCHHSQRKNEDPHSLTIEVVNSNGDAKISNA